MTRKRILTIPLAAFALLICASLLPGNNTIQGQADADEQFPSGKWMFSAHPYFGSDWKSLPVVVMAVTSDLTKGIRVTKVGLFNRSSKQVESVRLGWYLTTAQDKTTILKHGQTPFITPSGGLPLNIEREIEFNVFSFGKVARLLAKDGMLNGEFRVQVVVDEIRYEDGSMWSRQEATSIIDASHHGTAKPATQNPGSCPFQLCQAAVTQDGHVRYYYCSTSQDIAESCENHVTYCINRVCGGPVGP
jgi:hypothetical protein